MSARFRALAYVRQTVRAMVDGFHAGWGILRYGETPHHISPAQLDAMNEAARRRHEEQEAVQQMLDAIRFREIVREEAKRTILCEPGREHQIRAAVDQLGGADILTVRASRFCPAGKLLVINEGVMEAQQREWLQGLGKRP